MKDPTYKRSPPIEYKAQRYDHIYIGIDPALELPKSWGSVVDLGKEVPKRVPSDKFDIIRINAVDLDYAICELISHLVEMEDDARDSIKQIQISFDERNKTVNVLIFLF